MNADCGISTLPNLRIRFEGVAFAGGVAAIAFREHAFAHGLEAPKKAYAVLVRFYASPFC
jgi:hypothetical protein